MTYDVKGGVGTVTLARPDSMNSLDLEAKVALLGTLTSAAEDPAVRCLVLTGSGRAFCVGQDLREHAEALEAFGSGEATLSDTVTDHYNPLALLLATMPKPVVAAVNGVAAGAGAGLAFACDLRVLSEDASFVLAFTGIGLSCDTGSSWTLQRLVGRARALELLLLPGRVTAREALELGLATRVVPAADLSAAVAEVSGQLAVGPTRAYAAVRRAVTYAGAHGLEESLAAEAELMASTGATADHAGAVRAFLAKERPRFEGR